MDQPVSPPGESSRSRDRTLPYVITQSAWRVRDLPERLRPREEMERLGAQHVSDDVLLAILLRSGVKGANVVDLAQSLLREYGSLTALAVAPVHELQRIHGMGRVKAQVLSAALDLARRLSEEAAPDQLRIRTPSDVAGVLREQVRTLEREVFWVFLLDAKNTMKGRPVEASRGLLDASLVHPREVFRDAIRSATAAVVLAHNHPSGDPSPSAEDIRVTKQLVEAGRIVDIHVLDHVIIGRDGQGDGRRAFVSLREEGFVEFAKS